MQLPRVICEIIMDYYSGMMAYDFEIGFKQHLMRRIVHDELCFAYRYGTTYTLEFNGGPPSVIFSLHEQHKRNEM